MESSKRNSRKRPRGPLLRSTELVELLPRRTRADWCTPTLGRADSQQKAATACETCRLKKVKCSEGRPRCAYCSRHGFRCNYPQQAELNHEQGLKILLERLSQTETRLEQLEALCSRRDNQDTQSSSQSGGLEDQNSWNSSPSNSSFQSQVWHDRSESGAPLRGLRPRIQTVTNNPSRGSENGLETSLDLALFKNLKVFQYLGKVPIVCEEERQPFPDVLQSQKPSEVGDIPTVKQKFFDHVGSLYPLICESTLSAASDAVRAEGFQENMRSCLVLLVIAVVKAFSDVNSMESGLADYQRAMQLRSRLSAQLSLQYVHVLVFSAIFLLQKDRLLDFASALNWTCTLLHTVIKRDQASGIERPKNEKNNIRLLFWICHNLERDLSHEIDNTLPRSNLAQFMQLFPLPLPCEQAGNKDVPQHINTRFVFFLAEMSLRAIIEDIMTTPELDIRLKANQVTESFAQSSSFSPLVQELRSQLDTWILHLPASLKWTFEPIYGMQSAQSTRLKLLYWYARFALHRPMMLQNLEEGERSLPHLLFLEPFREGLLSALNLVKVFVMEHPDVDVIMANRLISAIELLRTTASKTSFLTFHAENVDDILKISINSLLSKFSGTSEWVLCKLYNILIR